MNKITSSIDLKNIKIRGFKSIKNIDLKLNNLNVIIGSNGVGKSNFINVFKFLQYVTNKNLGRYVKENGGADTLLHFGSKCTSEMSFELDFGINVYSLNLTSGIFDELIIAQETVEYKGEIKGHVNKIVNLIHDANNYETESKLPDNAGYNNIEENVVRYLQSYKVYHFHDTSKEAKVKKHNRASDNVSLHSDAGNLCSMLFKFKEKYPYNYNKIINAITLVAPYFQDFIIQNENDFIFPLWKHRNYENAFTFNDLSDGTLRFICLITLLLQPTQYLPELILIDEPELGLHPYAIRVLASCIQSLAHQGKQIIVSSQSVTLINEFEADDILIADLKDDVTDIRRLKKEEIANWIDDYKIGDIWNKNIIGGTPDDF